MLAAVPPSSTILEFGAGHGLFSRLAVEHGAAHAVSLDPDLRKVFGSFRHPKVAFVAGFDDCIRGRFDVVAILDVLYAIPPDEWDAILARVADRLTPGGVLLLKEADPTARLKQSWNRLQEWISSHFLGITLARGFFYEASPAMIERLRRAGFDDVESRRIDRWYPHPHLLYIAKKSY